MARSARSRTARRDAEDLVDVDELAREHRASPSAARRAIAGGALEGFGHGQFLRVRRRSFLAWHLGRLRGAAVIVDDR